MQENFLAQQLLDQVRECTSRLDSVETDIRKIQALESRLDSVENRIAEVIAISTNEPPVAVQAEQIGKRYASGLRRRREPYADEETYLEDFAFNLWRCDVITRDEEVASAIHIAMKAFPALELVDARLMQVWRVMCNDHLYSTTLNVEIGWIGVQDWFPGLFAEECFQERLERAELRASIEKMLEVGNMPWMLYFRYCDRSFPESYLPSFLNWLGQFCESGVISFFMRCTGGNRCQTNEEFYELIARLPKPEQPHGKRNVNMRDANNTLTLSEWRKWCTPKPKASGYTIFSTPRG